MFVILTYKMGRLELAQNPITGVVSYNKGNPSHIRRNRRRVNIRKIYRALRRGCDVRVVDRSKFVFDGEGWGLMVHDYHTTNLPAIEVF